MFVVIASVVLAIVLFLLPRKVLKDPVTGEQANTENSVESSENHASAFPLSSSNRMLVDSLIASFKANEELSILTEVSDIFGTESLFDSSAYYMNMAADKSQNLDLRAKAGDLYFQAYNMSLDPVQREELGERARENYDTILAVNPRDLHARTNKAMTYVSSSSPMQAISLLRQVLDDEPKYVPAIMSLGALSMQSGQYDKAVGRFKEVLAIDPNNLRGKLGLGYSLIEVGDKEDGMNILDQILQNNEIDEVLRSEIENTLNSVK